MSPVKMAAIEVYAVVYEDVMHLLVMMKNEYYGSRKLKEIKRSVTA